MAGQLRTGVAAGGPIISIGWVFGRARGIGRMGVSSIRSTRSRRDERFKRQSKREQGISARLARRIRRASVSPSIYYQSKAIHDAIGLLRLFVGPDSGRFEAGHIVPLPAADSYYLAASMWREIWAPAKLTSITSYFSRFATTVDDSTGLVGSLGATAGFRRQCRVRQSAGPCISRFLLRCTAEPNQTSQRILSQEVRLSSTDANARLAWVAGLFYSRSDAKRSDESIAAPCSRSIGFAPRAQVCCIWEPRRWILKRPLSGNSTLRSPGPEIHGRTTRRARGITPSRPLSGGLFNTGSPPVGTT